MRSESILSISDVELASSSLENFRKNLILEIQKNVHCVNVLHTELVRLEPKVNLGRIELWGQTFFSL